MPRTRKTISIDDKINEQKQVVSRAKAKYESALAELNDLMTQTSHIKKHPKAQKIGQKIAIEYHAARAVCKESSK